MNGMYFALINNKKIAYLMVLLLVLSSGSPWFNKYAYFYILIAIYFMFEIFRSYRLFYVYKRLWYYIFLMIGIFFFQFVVLGWNTLPGIINFISKIIVGSFILLALDYRIKYYYFRVMFHLAIISLFFFVLQLFGITFNLVDVEHGDCIFLYYAREDVWFRNSGAFWEPGAYGCYLMIVPLLFVDNFFVLYKKYKKESIVLLIALLTTQSTTAFIAFGILILLFIILQLKSNMKLLYLILSVGLFYYVYNNTAFLSEKIEEQSTSAIKADGKFNSTRLGTFLFDMHYVKKHPLFGNGIHGKTRYSDHQYLINKWSKGELAYGGNAFSDYLAKMGVVFYIIFFSFLYRTNRGVPLKIFFTFSIVYILLLFGEPLLNYPLGLALPFLCFHRKMQY